MSLETLRNRIREKSVGAQDKKVFLLEGSDDEEAFRILLGRFQPDWESRWAIGVAGKKDHVVKLLTLEPLWIGLVDRDEWDESMVATMTQNHPNLQVLPRFTLENYLINPDELWQALPPDRQASLGKQSTLKSAIQTHLTPYLRHGALWKVVTPLWSGLRSLGFKEALASEKSIVTAQDDGEIQRILQAWDTLLDPHRLFSEFQTHVQRAQGTPLREQYATGVHGKFFWQNIVNPALNQLLGQMPAEDRRRKIFQKLQLPADLQPILDRLK